MVVSPSLSPRFPFSLRPPCPAGLQPPQDEGGAGQKVSELSDDDQVAVFKALADYVRGGKLPEVNPVVKMALAFIVKDLDRNMVRWERTRKRRQVFGKQGGVAKASKRKQKVANVAVNVNENVNENVNDNVDVIKRECFINNARGALAADAASLSRRKEKFVEELKPYLEKYGREMLNTFCDYWSEPNADGTRMRWEMQRTWNTPTRLRLWLRSERPRKAPRASPPSRGSELLDRTEQMLARQDEAARRAVTREEYLRQKEEGLI